jgi:hypothetical protein
VHPSTLRSVTRLYGQRRTVALCGFLVCASILITHTLTYAIIGDGRGYEMNPAAFATLWMPPVLNVALWVGGMAGFMLYLYEKFDGNREVVTALSTALVAFALFDLANDVLVALQVGLI